MALLFDELLDDVELLGPVLFQPYQLQQVEHHVAISQLLSQPPYNHGATGPNLRSEI